MKRYTLLILTVLMLAPLLPFAELSPNLEDDLNPSWTSAAPSVTLTEESFPQVNSGQWFTCAMLGDGSLNCWGDGNNGKLGIGYSTSQNVPQIVDLGFGRTAANMSTGMLHTCTVLDNGALKCWGNGANGKLGSGTTDDKISPSMVNLGSGRTAMSVSAGIGHTCAILDNGAVSCWGMGSYGALGNGALTEKLTPTLTSSLGTNRTAVAISAGGLHTCAILDNGAVSCWGMGSYGALGNGAVSSQYTPTLTSSLGANRTAVAISSGYRHNCAILDNGSVSCWGWNNVGQLGNGGNTNQNTPQIINLGLGRTAVSISAQNAHTCAVLDNDAVSCWGDNEYGQLGIGTTTDQNTPQTVNLGLGKTAVSVSGGSFNSCAVLNDGSLTCWGDNTYNQFGDGTSQSRLEPSMNFTDVTPVWKSKTTAVEGQPMVGYFLGDLFDNLNTSQVTVVVDAPQGLNFSILNRSLTGTPLYTSQTQWNVTVINGTQQQSATYILQILADTDGDGTPNTLDTDDDGDGFGDPTDACPTQQGNSTMDVVGCPDNDGDGYSNSGDAFANDATQFSDGDQDGFGDNASGNLHDACPNTYGDSARGGILGCPDADGDRWADQIDVFVNDLSQWNDSDGDGFGDSLIGFQGDACPITIGMSTQDRFGCTDSDGDGWSDDGDLFSNNPTQWADRDGDGYGDNQDPNATMSDAFSADGTQWNDTDGDGHGDNPFGTQGDWFPNDATRWQDSDQDGVADEDDVFPNEKSQTLDTDGDGYGDDANGSDPDVFPEDSSEWIDTDADGVGNNADLFPFDPSQSNDLDGDGYGDNSSGNNPDAFPNDDSEWADTDGDEVGNNADAFPFDPSQQTDSDGDGFGDNERGSGADKFPNDSTQWSDIDGDGYGDNQDGTNPDAFIADPTQWADADEDGYGDNPTGRQADGFVNDATQWLDQDGDGLGDNLSGNNPDPYLFDFDNDGYNDSIDPLPKLASPGDLDNDGTPDIDDVFPEDFREWADADGDGEGDNADTDDDNDGWADTDELREGTDPFSSSSQPVNSFEIVLPGTTIGLGAWDLIGMFGGIPLFAWIGFGFVTRNGRTAKFETRLREANTRDELEGVARQWEYSLMLRLLGPHQGIRLERLRAELDDRYEAQNQRLSSIEPEPHDQTEMVEEAMNVDEKSVPAIQPEKPAANLSGVADGKGYEWIMQDDGVAWFRIENSDSEWELFEA